MVTEQKRPRGRPRKNPNIVPESVTTASAEMGADVLADEDSPSNSQRKRGRPRGASAKRVTVSEDVTEKILVNFADIVAVGLSSFTARRFGADNGMTLREGAALTEPCARLVARHMPSIGIDTKLPAADARDVEQIFLTITEYFGRLLAQTIAKARMRAAGVSREQLEKLRAEYERGNTRGGNPAQETNHSGASEFTGNEPVDFAGDNAAENGNGNNTLRGNTADMFSVFDAPTDTGESLIN